jgi:hypothetical protein
MWLLASACRSCFVSITGGLFLLVFVAPELLRLIDPSSQQLSPPLLIEVDEDTSGERCNCRTLSPFSLLSELELLLTNSGIVTL